jgi:Uma2 family endonuclease
MAITRRKLLAMATTKLWTIEEVERLPDDASQYALLRGVLYRMPPPGGRHGRTVLAIGAPLYLFVREHRLGVVYDQNGIILERDPDTLLGPDLAFVRAERASADDKAYPVVIPDLAVEVISPSQSGPSVEDKTAVYLAAGVRLIWIIDPERRTVRVHRGSGSESLLNERDEMDGEDVLPGFKLPVAQLFD